MSSPSVRLAKWLASPSNQVGLGLLVATTAQAFFTEIGSHTLSIPVVVFGAVSGLVALIVPDKTALKSDVAQLAEDAVAAALAKNTAAIPAVIADAEKVVADVIPAPAAPIPPAATPAVPAA